MTHTTHRAEHCDNNTVKCIINMFDTEFIDMFLVNTPMKY